MKKRFHCMCICSGCRRLNCELLKIKRGFDELKKIFNCK